MKYKLYICKCGYWKVKNAFKKEDFLDLEVCPECRSYMRSLTDKEVVQKLYNILFQQYGSLAYMVKADD